jgi:hypothetical protein
VHRLQVVERSPFVPRDNTATPVPEWKLDAALIPPDLLPAADPARAESERRARDPQAPTPPPTHAPFPPS